MKEDVDIKRWRKYGHRNRRKRRGKVAVYSGAELAEAFKCPREELEAQLVERGILYHLDSTGEVWASLKEDFKPV